ELDRSRTLREWIEWLQTFLRDDHWGIEPAMHRVPAGRFDVVRLDLAGWRALGDLLVEWRLAIERWDPNPERLSAAAFAARLDDLLTNDVALWTPMQHGVQVLEALAAAYRSFDHLFIVGVESGQFPVRPPASP